MQGILMVLKYARNSQGTREYKEFSRVPEDAEYTGEQGNIKLVKGVGMKPTIPILRVHQYKEGVGSRLNDGWMPGGG